MSTQLPATPDTNDTTRAAADEKLRLIALLDRSRRSSMERLRGADDYAIVYPESGWRVTDIIGHLAAWEREALACLQAHTEHEEYSLGDEYELERYNAEAYQKRRGLDPAQCRMDWGMVRRDLQHAIHDVPDERLFMSISYPWGGEGTPTGLVEWVVRHEEAHVREIAGS